MNLIWTAPPDALSGCGTAVVTVTSSTASGLGRMLVKNPSPLFSILSWMLAPSRVMFIALFLRPPTDVVRGTPGVCIPGSIGINFMALIAGRGRSEI
jgi:hypothetical protein